MATLPATFFRLRLLPLAGGRKRLGWEPVPGLEVAWSDDLKRCPCELNLLRSNQRNKARSGFAHSPQPHHVIPIRTQSQRFSLTPRIACGGPGFATPFRQESPIQLCAQAAFCFRSSSALFS